MEEWDSAIEQAIKVLGTSFDTHKVIQEVAHRNQRQYVAALAVVAIGSSTPFHKLHSSLGRRVKIVAQKLGFTKKNSRSLDMFGQSSICLAWSR